MKKIISIIMTLILAVGCVLSLSGCSFQKANKEPESIALSVVMGAHKNFPKLSYAVQSIQPAVYEACYSYGDVSTFTVEGKPSICGDYTIERPDKSITDTKRKMLARQNSMSIVSDCSRAAATTEEVDTLAALKLSANDLQASSASKKEMLVYDSGLCTSGLLNQTANDVLSADPQTITEKLSDIHALPDLKGIRVKWVGLGCVAGGQSEIPDSYKYKLEKLWEKIIVASGGEIEFDRSPVCGEEAQGLPDVSPVSFAQDSLGIDFTAPEAVSNPVRFDESVIRFVADKAEFIDPASAEKALEPIAEILNNNKSLNIIIAGTTASAGDGYELSLRRAETCRDTLVSMGAKESQIECIGLGSSDNCFHVDDLDSNGRLIEEYAKLNRAIYIFSSDSDIAKTVKGI